MDTDYERVMETIFKPVWCILKSVKIRVIRGQNSIESPCNFGVRVQRRPTRQARFKTHLVGLRLQFRLLPEWVEPFSFDGSVHGEIVAR